jgi:site-specific DNA-cytosine methylase
MKRTCLSLFCGLGGGSLGFAQAGWHTVGVDVDEAALADYRTITGHPAHRLDLSTATPADLRACVGQAPDVILTSPPCQAFSGCLPLSVARSAPYVEMSSLAERGLWLALEAWPEAPPRLILLENVPRIQSRGRDWLDAVAALLRAYGYAWRETTHDCADIGGLAQRRRRFLGVARLQRCAVAPQRVVEEILYEPPAQRVRGVGEILGDLPVPGPWAQGAGGRLHDLPRLSAINWVRLACIPAGRDWRALPERVRQVSGDLRSTCQRREGSLGVTDWRATTHAVIGAASAQNTGLQVTDPRLPPRAARQNEGWSSVADDRWPVATHELRVCEGELELVGPPIDIADPTPTILVIRALDGTWHRPMTTLELAALQSLPTCRDGQWLKLSGRAHKAWRQRIGNAIPSATAYAIAKSMSRTLDASDAGGLLLSSSKRWVSPTSEVTL